MASEDRMNLCAAVLPALPVFVRAFPPLVPDAVRLLQRMFESCCAHSACVCVRAEQLSVRAPSPSPSWTAPFDACESGALVDAALPAAELPEDRLAHMLCACFQRVVRCSPLLRPFL